MPSGVEAQDGGQILPDSVNAVLEGWGDTEYLHTLLGLADPTIASTSQADRREPEQQRRGRNRPRAMSSVSHCANLDYFDPRGVGALRHTLSRMSTAQSMRAQIGRPEDNLGIPGQRLPTAEMGGGAFDFEAVLRDVLKRHGEADIKSRELGVLFDQLRVVGKGTSSSLQSTLGSGLNPMNVLRTIQDLRHPHLYDIISGFQGVVRPGEMLLVLGRPGSGCTTLLKVLANWRDEFHAVEGEVCYNSFSPDDIRLHYRGDVQYCPEDDVHFPTLSVEQTIGFAAKTRAPHARAQGLSRKEFWVEITDILMTLFGLRHVRRTPVGDAALRGVSGGEKKRVSISETLATRNLLACWDNSTRGLDASTAVEYVHALRIATNLLRVATIVSIYQAGESLYEMFDKVCLIYEGRMVYFGPANDARQYFIDMGYEPANRQTTSDFLVAVTDPNGRQVRDGMYGIPSTSEEFERYYRQSLTMQENLEDIASFREQYVGKEDLIYAYRESAKAERARHMQKHSPYTISIPMQIRSVMARRVQIQAGAVSLVVINACVFILQAIILGTTFLQLSTNTTAYYSRGGILFFAIFLPALFAMSEIPSLFSMRPIIQRHYKAAMYHPFVEAIALTLVDVPITFTIILLYSIVLYFLVGLQTSAGQFFIFFLFVFVTSLLGKALFRSLAAAFKSEAPAQAFAGILILVVSLYTGYIIPQPSMIGALRWITYINPIRYSFESLIANEFHTINGFCGTLVPSGPLYGSFPDSNKACTTVGSQTGDPFVNGNNFVLLSYGYSYSHLWRNLGIVIAFAVFFIILLLIFTEFNTSLAGATSVVLFKQGADVSAIQDEISPLSNLDEEKPKVPSSTNSESDARRENKEDIREALEHQAKTRNTFTWQEMNYEVAGRRLLNDVAGFVAPGRLTALMGESGAGKTTLLNVLAERTETGVVSGTRLVNGHPLPPDFQAQTGYCQQTDTHLETMTVREALLFSAKLRQPFSVPATEKEAYVERCLKMCGLDGYKDAIVGSLGVEMKKRMTIGVELAAKPKLLLFLDEPTSGLDSQSAWAIVSFLRDLADSGQAILCTIHQPSAELFQVFDRLLLLRMGGETVYFGDIGPSAATLIQYFEGNGSRHCDAEENPAEFILDVIGAGATATSKADWHQIWTNSPESTLVNNEIDGIVAEGQNTRPVSAVIRSGFATPWVYQVWTLLMRNLAHYWRSPTYVMAKMMLNIVGGLFIGFTFFQRNNSLSGTQNKLFAVFMALILSVPLANQLQVVFLNLRDVYEIRERPSRIYSWPALVTSQILVELPWNMLGSTLFFLCWYWTVGFPTDRAAYTFLLLGVLFPIYYTTIGQAVAAMSPTAEIAGILFSFLFSFVLTFNGVVQPFSQLGWWQWMYRLSPYTYLIEGLVSQILSGQSIQCSAKEFAVIQPPSGYSCASYLDPFISSSGGYLQNPDAGSNCLYCSASTADAWLFSTFNIQYVHRWRNVGLFCAFIVFNICAMYAFTYLFRIRSYKKSKIIVEHAMSRARGVLKLFRRAPNKDKETNDHEGDES
ncbi:ABC-2 type transporter-domain-containing protein [Butyriboletus roseoflavus]|nr:ABC-2 type transporter-domain-containing protein [Butyriboletus roseoflavus]